MESSSELRSNVEFVKAKTLLDFVRSACDFGTGIKPIYAIKDNDKYRLLSFCEVIGKSNITCYYDVEKLSNYIVYRIDEKESVDMVDRIDEGVDYKRFNFHIIEIEKWESMNKNDNKEKVDSIKFKDYKALVKVIADVSNDDNYIKSTYSFVHNGKTVIGTFSNLSEDEPDTFIYADFIEENKSFLVYNYRNDGVSTSNTIVQNMDFYVKIVNLAEPFGFLIL